MKEERTIEPETFAHLVSSTLYERRFGPYFVEPVIAGKSTSRRCGWSRGGMEVGASGGAKVGAEGVIFKQSDGG